MPPVLTIVLPAYNEELCIADVVGEWLAVAGRVGGARVMVVDDGSRDNTRHILNGLLQRHPELAVVHQQNGGHGAAIQLGYRMALDHQSEWIFQTDSDGQTSAADFEAFWQARGQAPFQIGYRGSRRDPLVRVLLSRFHVWVIDLLFQTPIPDPNVPFRLMRADLVRSYLELIPAGTFAPNVLLSVLAFRHGHLRVRPIRHAARASGETSVKGARLLKLGLRSFREYLAFRPVLRRAIF